MIVKIGASGSNMRGLVSYLYSEGRFNEHTDQRMVASTGAGQIDILGRSMFHPGDAAVRLDHEALSRDEALQIGRELERYFKEFESFKQPVAAGSGCCDGTESPVLDGGDGDDLLVDQPFSGSSVSSGQRGGHVMHVILSVPTDERALSDEDWARIAADYMREMGWADGSENDPNWAAFRHGLSGSGNDHLHIAICKVRPDGAWLDEHYSGKRSRAVVDELEVRYGLIPAKDNASQKGRPSHARAEHERRSRDGRSYSERDLLESRVRASAARCSTEKQFVADLLRHGVRVRPRFKTGGTSQVVGYSVSLREGSGTWFGGGKLGDDLTLTALRKSWRSTSESEREALPLWTRQRAVPRDTAGAERYEDAWSQAARQWRSLADDVESLGARDTSAMADAANALSGGLGAMAYSSKGKQLDALVSAAEASGRVCQRRDIGGVNHARYRDAVRTVSLALRGSQADSRAGWYAVLVQMQRTQRALQMLHAARAERRRAELIASSRDGSMRRLVQATAPAKTHARLPGREPQAAMRLPHERVDDGRSRDA